jgi:uncharacterized protein YcsI (UPF0317 family)
MPPSTVATSPNKDYIKHRTIDHGAMLALGYIDIGISSLSSPGFGLCSTLTVRDAPVVRGSGDLGVRIS